MPGAPPYLKAIPGGIELELVVQPRASRSKVVGEHDSRLKVQIAAPPVDGEANAEVIAFFSQLFGVPKRQVELVSGETSKRKRIRVNGITLEAALAEL